MQFIPLFTLGTFTDRFFFSAEEFFLDSDRRSITKSKERRLKNEQIMPFFPPKKIRRSIIVNIKKVAPSLLVCTRVLHAKPKKSGKTNWPRKDDHFRAFSNHKK